MKKFLVLVLTLFIAFNSYAQSRGMKEVAETNLGNKVNIGKQYALFIAIDDYREWTPLKKPVSDAKEIRDILKNDYYIDEVIELYNEQATKQNIIRTFNDLQKKIGVHDSLFIYYAGHGYLEDGSKTGFWIPVDGGSDTSRQLDWLPNSQIRGYIAGFKTLHVFLVSDSCFSGDLLIASRSSPPQIDNEYLRKAYTLTSRQVMTSGAIEQVPDQSEFSSALINTLRKNTEPLISPSEIFPDVRRSIRKTMPMFGPLGDAKHQDGAEFIFFRRQNSVAVKTQNENVYFVGMEYEDNERFSDALYWLNGQKNILPKTGKYAKANAITVLGSNIYIAGFDDDNAVYWQNGRRNVLQKTKKYAVANAIVISGSNIYITGFEFNSYTENYGDKDADAVFWLNGKKNILPKTGNSAEARAIGISGTNVYIAGYEYNDSSGLYAVYWLNGKKNILPKTGNSAEANAIAITGSNIYIAGYEEYEDHKEAVYWLNGKKNILPKKGNFAEANTILITGSNIYIAGYEERDGIYYAVYWLNGQIYVLPTIRNYAFAEAITVSGSNVYIAGVENLYDEDAVYWLNGQRFVLPKTQGYKAYTYAITVTP